VATVRLADVARNARVTAIITAIDAGPAGGTVKVYTGAMPATPATAPSGTLLLTFTFDAVASFSGPVAGVAALDATPALAAVGAAAGTAGWARIADSTGATVMDCDVSATGAGGALQLSTTTV
jgi:hypothetical protein